MNRPLKVALLAGEASGDTLGAGLMKALKAKHSNIEFAGIGGHKMTAQGLISRVPMERLSVMGISEVLGRLPELLRIRKAFFQWCMEWQPDVFIGIDAPDFNIPLEKKLKAAGLKTVHYVSPSVWAWRKGRIKNIRKAVDHMLTLLPFEADFYHHENIPVTFVGHTLADALPIDSDKTQAKALFHISPQENVVAMLPGSRRNEVAKLFPLFWQTLIKLSSTVEHLRVLIPAANEARREQIDQLIAEQPANIRVTVLDQQADDAIAAADAVLVASGTATLQTMLWKTPMVVAYRMSDFSFWLMSKLATTRWVALPNILEQRDWVPERLQDDATVEQLCEDMNTALTDELYRKDFADLATQWHKKLALNADEQAANAILGLAIR
jgi:lipid-A-disaccharide synthase